LWGIKKKGKTFFQRLFQYLLVISLKRFARFTEAFGSRDVGFSHGL
jgi:hypothetical protein